MTRETLTAKEKKTLVKMVVGVFVPIVMFLTLISFVFSPVCVEWTWDGESRLLSLLVDKNIFHGLGGNVYSVRRDELAVLSNTLRYPQDFYKRTECP